MYAGAAPKGAGKDDVCEHQAPHQQQPSQQQQQPQQQAQQPPPRGQQPDNKNGNGRGDSGHPPHWWIDPQLRQQLAITDAQSKAVEEIWQKTLPDLKKFRDQLTAADDQVSKLVQDGAPEASVVALVEQAENTRAQANKARTLMIYRMYKVLTPEQRAKVMAIHPIPRDDRRGGGRRH